MQTMKMLFGFVVAALLGQGASEAETPVSKALQLLSGLSAKVTADGEKAKQLQEEFAEFCKDRSKDLAFEIKTGKSQVASLNAAIEEHSATVSTLTSKIDDLVTGISRDDADLQAAVDVRAKETADFEGATKELNDIIDTLNRAIGILEREMQKGGASMLQLQNAGSLTQAFSALVQASALSSADASKLTALVQSSQTSNDEDNDAALGAPAAAVYKSQSGNIVDTLSDLLDEAHEQLRDAQKKETAAVHNFQLLQQSLSDSVNYATKDMSEAKQTRSSTQEKHATAQGDLAATSKELDADQTGLAELNADCIQKAKDYAAAAKSRAEELAALAEAERVISDMTGNAEKFTYGFNQVSFLQETQMNPRPVLRFLRELTRKHNSPALAQLASHVASVMRSGGQGDVFAKVKGLISDLIDKLEGQAASEATKKAFCDKETAESNAAKDEKTNTVEGLTTKIDQMQAQAAQLKDEVATLQKELAKLAKAHAAMNKLRQEEHSAFVTNEADLKAGVEGVQIALRLLRDYYGADGKAHDASEGASTGIIGALEVVESDFSRDLATITVTEEAAQADFEKQTHQNDIEKATKEQDVKYKAKEGASLEKAASELVADRATVQAELDAVVEYLAKLHDQCVPKAETYAERKAQRDSEIAGLRQALDILEGQAALLLQTRSLRGVRAHRTRA